MRASGETNEVDQADRCWDTVDRYLADLLVGVDPVLDAALTANSNAGLPRLDVSPLQGKLLHLITRLARAQTILEIGTLGGYSTIWLARALPRQGPMITLEADPRHAAANIARSGLAYCVDVRVGRALETLPKIEAEGIGPFDLIFIRRQRRRDALTRAASARQRHRSRRCSDQAGRRRATPSIVMPRTTNAMLAGSGTWITPNKPCSSSPGPAEK